MIKERKNIDIILPCHFFASVNVYALYYVGVVHLEAFENFQKRSLRSRCAYKSDKGLKHFSVPLKSGKNQQKAIQKVEISYEEDWVKTFSHSLKTCYSGSPFLDFYFDKILCCLNKKHKYLWDLNLELNRLMIDLLDMGLEMHCTKEWLRNYENPTIDLRNNIPDLDIDHSYPQLFQEKGVDFIEDLSILDLLFCCGPEAPLHLKIIADQIIDKNNMF